MRCPFCLTDDTQVKDSRQSADGRFVKRRRYCTKCDSRFTTHERIEHREIIVIKKDGHKRLFDRDKLLKAIYVAVRKRDIDNDQIELLVDNIIKDIEQSGESEVKSKKIGEAVMMALAKLDQVAYVRFASVYHDFSEAKDFEEFLSKLEKK
ncbi:MAG: transcriptional repressor NrdR [Rickettsiales bacterium]|nr:transcriptional repressor NrdR [Rickettsiales bacterium]